MFYNPCKKSILLFLIFWSIFDSGAFAKVLEFDWYRKNKSIQYDDSLRKIGIRFFPPVRVVDVSEITNNRQQALSGKMAITPLVLNDISKNSIDIYFDEPQEMVSFFVISQKWYDPESVIEYKTELFDSNNNRLSSFTNFANSSEEWKKISVRSRGIRRISISSRNFSFMYADNFFLVDNIEFYTIPENVTFSGDTTPPEIDIITPGDMADIVNNQLFLDLRGYDENGIFSLKAQLLQEKGNELLYEQILCGDLRNGYCSDNKELVLSSIPFYIPDSILYRQSDKEQRCKYLLRIVAEDMEGNESIKEKLIRTFKIPNLHFLKVPKIRKCNSEVRVKISRAYKILKSNAREIIQQLEFVNSKDEPFPIQKQKELKERYIRRFNDIEIIICNSKSSKGKGFFSPFSRKLFIQIADDVEGELSINEIIARLAVQMAYKAPIPRNKNSNSEINHNLIYQRTLNWNKIHCLNYDEF